MQRTKKILYIGIGIIIIIALLGFLYKVGIVKCPMSSLYCAKADKDFIATIAPTLKNMFNAKGVEFGKPIIVSDKWEKIPYKYIDEFGTSHYGNIMISNTSVNNEYVIMVKD